MVEKENKENEIILLYRGETFNPNFYYFSGLDISNSFLFLHGKRKKLLVSPLEKPGVKKAIGMEVVVLEDFYQYLKKRLKGRKVYIDGNRLSARMFERLRKFCKPFDASERFYTKRMVKRKEEIEKIRKACSATRAILNSLDVRKGMSENEVKKQILIKTMEAGLEPAFEPIVASGPNTAVPHHLSSDAKIGNFVLIDYGVRVGHYCSDVTRCFSLGKEGKGAALYEKLQNIFWNIVDEIPNMEKSREVEKLYERLLKSEKLPPPIHSVGHGVGLEIHEFPRFGKKYSDDIKNTVFTIEPGTYMNGYGARFEETIYYDGKRVRIL